MLGRVDDLTQGRLLARNVGLNLAGWLLPAVVALVAIPALLRAMGEARFGVLALAWTLVGYFSLFDLGIGRALTQALSERVGTRGQADSPALTWTALWLLLPFGLVCAALLALAAPALVERVLAVPEPLRDETVLALRILALGVPAMTLTSGLRAVLEAGQRFQLINALRVPLGILTFGGPLLVQAVSHRLPPAVAVLVVARTLVFAAHAVVVGRAFPRLRRPRPVRRADVARLWRVAGWMTVSSVVSPVLVSADRFVVGAVLPVAAVAHYATASEVATKMWLFSAALLPVLFPAIAATLVREPARAAALFDRGVRATVLVLAPAALVLVLFAREGLALWVGAAFAREAAPVLQWLAIAVFANTVAQVPYAVVQGAGRADIAGRLHLVELPLYAGLLWALLPEAGLEGVAIAWLARMVGDGLALLAATARVLPAARDAARRAAVAMLGTVVVLAGCTLLSGLWARVAVALVVLPAVALVGWARLVTPDERTLLRQLRVGRLARARPAAGAEPAGDPVLPGDVTAAS
jgi:O-antigen/teichoic acid export membrane protein